MPRIILFAVPAALISACIPNDYMSTPQKVGACQGAVPGTMRVASYNVASGAMSSLDEIGNVIEQMSPDVIALQEVNDGALSGGGKDQVKVLADRLGYQATYAATLSRGGIGTYGIALLSRYPFNTLARIDLRAFGAAEPRVAIDAVLCAGEKHIHVLATHADVWQPQPNIDELAAHLPAHVGEATLVVGDLNEKPTEAGPKELEGHGLSDLIGHFAEGPTFWSDPKRIDYVLADDSLSKVATGGAIGTSKASDHYPVWVDFDLSHY